MRPTELACVSAPPRAWLAYSLPMHKAAVTERYLRVPKRAHLAVAVIAAFIVSMPAAACSASGPSILGLFLDGRRLSDAVHEQLVEAVSRRDNLEGRAQESATSLVELDHALSTLSTHLWGQYLVSLYSRRLHEVLDRLDSKPPGPVTSYYDRWDGSQINSSVLLVTRDADAVDAALARTRVLSREQSAMLQQHLGRIREELQGCIVDRDSLSNFLYPP